MTKFTSSLGVTRDVDVDLDAVMDYEKSYGKTLKDVMDGIATYHICDMDLMARFLGFESYKELVDLGYTLEDMTEMVMQSKYLGFTDSSQATGRD